jgi:predicted RND superfamily exporter protein
MFNNADTDQRKRLVDDSYRKANVTITLRNASTYEYDDVFERMQQDIYDSLNKIKAKYPSAKVSITGMFVLKMKLERLLILTGLQSFSVAFIVINILFFVIFVGSVKAGLIAIVPNVIPSILDVGLMGMLDIPLDFFAIVLAPIIIGISVDDTIHFLTHYRMQYAIDKDIHKALAHTMKEAGQGIVFTTLVLCLGFGILAISSTPGVAKVGIFGSLAMIVGLLNDLFLLPALITIFKLRGEPVIEEKPHAALVNT